MYMTHTVMSLM